MIDIPGATTIHDTAYNAHRLQGCVQFMVQREGVPVVHLACEKLAREIAEMISREQKFFSVAIDHNNGYGSARASVNVLTDEEYAAALRKAFQDGVAHAHRFAPLHYCPPKETP